MHRFPSTVSMEAVSDSGNDIIIVENSCMTTGRGRNEGLFWKQRCMAIQKGKLYKIGNDSIVLTLQHSDMLLRGHQASYSTPYRTIPPESPKIWKAQSGGPNMNKKDDTNYTGWWMLELQLVWKLLQTLGMTSSLWRAAVWQLVEKEKKASCLKWKRSRTGSLESMSNDVATTSDPPTGWFHGIGLKHPWKVFYHRKKF